MKFYRSAATKILLASAAAALFILAGASAQNPLPAPPLPPGAPSDLAAAANVLFNSANQVQPGRIPHLLLRVFRRLAHDQSAQIPFTEIRQFAISKQPIRQTGTLRSSKDRGLSMAYEGAKPRVLVIDDKGLIERSPDGHERQVTVADHPELGGLTDLYLNLLRGNSERLFDFADVYFTGTVHGWQLGLSLKDPAMAKRTGRVVIDGSAREMHRIENTLPNGDTRLLELGAVERNPKFTPDVVNTYFRGTS